MPPEQRQGFFDLVHDRFGFSAHRFLVGARKMTGHRAPGREAFIDSRWLSRGRRGLLSKRCSEAEAAERPFAYEQARQEPAQDSRRLVDRHLPQRRALARRRY